jgi:hypothetical protein
MVASSAGRTNRSSGRVKDEVPSSTASAPLNSAVLLFQGWLVAIAFEWRSSE